MSTTTIRYYRSPADSDAQYSLWLRATAGLPYAWRSSLTNARHITEHGPQFPGARLYAERDDHLVGYIGTHPPVRWDTGEWLIPFGFPWTYPVDPALEAELYERMAAATPTVYAGHAASGYVQRFRSSWTRQLGFLVGRGWQQRWRRPLLGRAVDPAGVGAANPAVPIEANRLASICDCAQADPHAAAVPDLPELRERLAGGWLDADCLWEVPQAGVFEMEVRRPWGEVRLLYARPGTAAFDRLWTGMALTAHRQDATEVYLTIDDSEAARADQLRAHSFREVDAGVYLARSF